MESLSLVLSSSPPPLTHTKTRRSAFKYILHFKNSVQTHKPILNISLNFRNSLEIHSLPTCKNPNPNSHSDKPSINLFLRSISIPKSHEILISHHLSLLAAGLCFPVSCFATEASTPTEELSNKINLEAILVSIDEFFNRYPFFVAGVTFIWLVVIPLAEEYFSKYKFISAMDAFRKLRDDPNSQLIDIRDNKSLAFLNSPNLKIINKGVVQVEFREGYEEGFVKKVMEKIEEPANTTICVLDNFDGNSIKVAELLVKSGFKEAYAIRGGIRGKKGWQDIQESLLPPSVHIYPKKNVKNSQQADADEVNVNQDQASSARATENISNGHVQNWTQPASQKRSGRRSSSPYPKASQKRSGRRSSSPYPNHPDLKPPSSPKPSKPRKIR